MLWRAAAGPGLWAAGFSILYGIHGIGCSGQWERTLLVGTIIALWMLLVVAAGLVVWWTSRLMPGVERRIATTCAASGFAAMVVTGLPALTVSACL